MAPCRKAAESQGGSHTGKAAPEQRNLETEPTCQGIAGKKGENPAGNEEEIGDLGKVQIVTGTRK